MSSDKEEFNPFPMHALNPNAPEELSAFNFLLGSWDCEVTVQQEDGSSTELQATWYGQTILDGFVIADEYRMSDLEGDVVMLGMNYRTYNTKTNTWNMKWLEALSGTWLDLGPEELGGVQVTKSDIRYKVEFKPGELHRIMFFDISEHHFSWRVDISKDGGDNWEQSVMTIQAHKK